MNAELQDLVCFVHEFGTARLWSPDFLLGHVHTVETECDLSPGDRLWPAALSLADGCAVQLMESTPTEPVRLFAERINQVQGSCTPQECIRARVCTSVWEENPEHIDRFVSWFEDRLGWQTVGTHDFLTTTCTELTHLGFGKILALILDATRRGAYESLDLDYLTYVHAFVDAESNVFLERIDLDEVMAAIEM